MKNLDFINNAKTNFAKQLKEAFADKDEAKMTSAFEQYATSLQQTIIDTAAEVGATADNAILAKRGFRQLTSAEQSFYNNIKTASKAVDVKQSLAGLDVTIPQTVIDTVLEDISNEHPLLDAINIENTYGSVKAIFATDTNKWRLGALLILRLHRSSLEPLKKKTSQHQSLQHLFLFQRICLNSELHTLTLMFAEFLLMLLLTDLKTVLSMVTARTSLWVFSRILTAQ
jgi:hypothetical protein